jgi:hypothetical protein
MSTTFGDLPPTEPPAHPPTSRRRTRVRSWPSRSDLSVHAVPVDDAIEISQGSAPALCFALMALAWLNAWARRTVMGNTFYSAGSRAMSESWKNFFFNVDQIVHHRRQAAVVRAMRR